MAKTYVPEADLASSFGSKTKRYKEAYVQRLTAEEVVTDQLAVLGGSTVSGGDGLARKPSTAYQVGDIATSPLLKSYQRLECVKAGTTSDDINLPITE